VRNILIVGAGPTGLAGALALLHHGIAARIVERRTAPSPLSRAVGLLPSSMQIFDRLGVGDRLRHAAVVIERAAIHTNGALAATLALDADPDPDVRLLSLPQDRTEAILAAALAEAGLEIEYGAPLTGLSVEDARAEAVVRGAAMACEEVLGADGARSTVREALDVEAEGFDLPETWSIADLDLAEPVPAQATIHLDGPNDAVFMIPMEARRVRLVSNTPDALDTLGDRLSVVSVRRKGTFRIAVRQVPVYRIGAVSLAGDAAHTHSPVGGRGMNLGIADAAEWADRLAAGTLDGYSASRHAAGAHTIRLSEGARRAIVGGNGARRALAVAALRLASRVPPVSRRIARRILLG